MKRASEDHFAEAQSEHRQAMNKLLKDLEDQRIANNKVRPPSALLLLQFQS